MWGRGVNCPITQSARNGRQLFFRHLLSLYLSPDKHGLHLLLGGQAVSQSLTSLTFNHHLCLNWTHFSNDCHIFLVRLESWQVSPHFVFPVSLFCYGMRKSKPTNKFSTEVKLLTTSSILTLSFTDLPQDGCPCMCNREFYCIQSSLAHLVTADSLGTFLVSVNNWLLSPDSCLLIGTSVDVSSDSRGVVHKTSYSGKSLTKLLLIGWRLTSPECFHPIAVGREADDVTTVLVSVSG